VGVSIRGVVSLFDTLPLDAGAVSVWGLGKGSGRRTEWVSLYRLLVAIVRYAGVQFPRRVLSYAGAASSSCRVIHIAKVSHGMVVVVATRR